MVSVKAKISIPDDVYFQALVDEAVILHTTSGKYFGLDEVGTRMWNLIAEHGALEPVIPILLAEYEVDEERLTQDLVELVDKLADRGLVAVGEEQTH